MTEQWQELKETITELRDNDGTGTQQEVCKFLANYMDVLEKQMQQPCEDAISRQAVLDGVDRYIYKSQSTGTQDDFYSFTELVVKQLPPVIPQPKTGRWMPIEYDGYADGYPVWDKWECSECGWEHSGDKESLTAFCPYCGVKMESEEQINHEP